MRTKEVAGTWRRYRFAETETSKYPRVKAWRNIFDDDREEVRSSRLQLYISPKWVTDRREAGRPIRSGLAHCRRPHSARSCDRVRAGDS
jgi:hypothetical protein